jgi:putative peptidoglycan lipid II flippase
MILTIIAKIFGFLREITLSYVYGASSISDAFITGSSLSEVLFAGVAGAIMVAYVPVGAKINEQKQLSRYTSNVMNMGSIVIFAIIIICMAFIKPLISLLAVGYVGQTYTNTIIIGFFALLSSLFLFGTHILNGYLNLNQYFSTFAIQSIFSNSIMIITFCTKTENAYVMGLSFLLSLFVPFVVIFYVARNKGLKYQFVINYKDEQLRKVLSLAAPMFASQIAIQINGVIDRSLASSLDAGTVSAMKYANLLCMSFNSVFSGAVGSVLYPRISAESDNKARLEQDIKKTMMIMGIVIIPIIILSVILSKEIISIIFERGAFEKEMVAITAASFAIYAIGLLGNGCCEVLNRLFYVIGRVKNTVICYCTGVLLNICLNFVFIRMWGYKGLALATSISAVYMMLYLIVSLKRSMYDIDFGKVLLKAVFAGIFMIPILIGTKLFVSNLSISSGALSNLTIISCGTLLGTGMYVLILHLVRVRKDIEINNAGVNIR